LSLIDHTISHRLAPVCRVTNSGAQTITTATLTPITFDTEIFDPYGMHSTTSNTSRITVATPGYYMIEGLLSFNVSSGGRRVAYLKVNNATFIDANEPDVVADGTAAPALKVCTIYYMSSGNYVELIAYHTKGSDVSTVASGAHVVHLSAIWLAP